MDASPSVPLQPKWYTVAQVAELLGYGESKVRMLIIQGDLRSLKDGWPVPACVAGVGGCVRGHEGLAG
jgi:excisionase family DNA binding protein